MQIILIIAFVAAILVIAVLSFFLSKKSNQLKQQVELTKKFEESITDFSAKLATAEFNLSKKEEELKDWLIKHENLKASLQKSQNSIHKVSCRFSIDMPDSKAISALLFRAQGTVKKTSSFKTQIVKTQSGEERKEVTIAFIKPE